MMLAEALQIIQRYSRSYYLPDTAQGWFEAHEQGRRIGDRACAGTRVPHATGRELVSAMVDNVRAARDALASTASRMRQARQDGLLDRDVMAGLSKPLKEQWLNAVATVKGDYSRAVAELRHWQEYAEHAAGEPGPDPRLPAEGDDAEVPF